jgi:hypothetical protein
MANADARELQQLRGDLARLERKLSWEKHARTGRRRSGVTWGLIVLAALATTVALVSLWTFRTINDTERFVERVGGVIEEPEVAAVIGDRAAGQLVQAIDLETRVRDRLPDDTEVMAAPLTAASQQVLARGTTALLETDQFQRAWDVAVAAGHDVSIRVLRADREAIQTTDGAIVVNLVPVISALLEEGAEFLSNLLGRAIQAPTVTPQNVDAAIGALEQQLGVALPADFGQLTLVESDRLAAVQSAYQSARLAVWLAPLAAIVLIGAALIVAPQRLRALLFIVIGVALGMLLVAVALQPLEQSLLDRVADETLRPAVSAAYDAVMHSLRVGIVVVTVLGVIAALGLVATGPSRAGELSRRGLERLPVAAARHRGWFLAAGAVVALAVLAAIPDRTWVQLFVVMGLYAAFALAVGLAPFRPRDDAAPQTTPEEPGPSDPAL